MYICGEKFNRTYKTEKETEKYKYRGCAHSTCNLNVCSRYFKIPVFFIT